MPKAKANNRIYRHYVDKQGRFATECYIIGQLMLVPSAYRLYKESDRTATKDLPAAWAGKPRAAELWTADPDPDKAYAVLLSSAKKDLDDARGRLAVYEKLYDRLMNAVKKGDDEP